MEGLLTLVDVTKRFGGLTAISHVGFGARPQEILGLIGPNGAGKTTLINIVSGILRPEEGKILLAGRDIVGLQPEDICRLGVGRTFQIVQSFPSLTVDENVRVGVLFGRGRRDSPTNGDRAVRNILEFVGLESKASVVAKDLTVAEMKKLEVARALAVEPKLVLLDEVFTGLAPLEIQGVIGVVRKVRDNGTAVIIVEHNMKIIMSLCDRVIVLDHGELIAEGTPSEIREVERVVKAYLGEG